MSDVDEAGPGGLLGLSTTLDPYIAKSDSLSGNVLGIPGELPPMHSNLVLKVNLLKRVIGSKEEMQVSEIKTGDVLMITTGTTRTVGSVVSARKDSAEVSLKIPICAAKGARTALSRQFSGRWRLIGWAEII
jgi:translation initiation factor 2 subunit 3